MPADNFYRQLEAKLDLSFIHELVSKYDDKHRLVKPNAYRMASAYWINPGDETATKVGKKQLGYRLQYGIGGGKARIIVKCLVTPA